MERSWRLAERTADRQHEDHTLTHVAPEPDGWGIGSGAGCFWIPRAHGVEPHVGDLARFYGRGFGSPVRGVDLNGVPVFYETATEYDARFERELAEKRERDRAHYYDTLAVDHQRRVAALPPEFVARINGFWKRNPEFWEHEGYELFCCEQAVMLAQHFGSPEAITAFHALPYEEQRVACPDLSDGHSGNTFGVACSLASVYLQSPEYIATMHGALCPLVGCAEYVCWAASPEAAAERADRGES